MLSAMTTERIDPPLEAAERDMLVAWLDYHRATLAMKCDGLDDGQLRQRAVPPSSLSLLGLVRHMAEVERGWFRRTLGGEDAPPRYYSEDNPDGDFDDVDRADVAEAFATWRADCDDARQRVAAAASLEVTGLRRGDPRERFSLRWILVHMIEEYARHNGHADLLRERIDGTVGD
jgi:uncharacterized damage-inducible protein DinB